jgi:putative transcriptional regulator
LLEKKAWGWKKEAVSAKRWLRYDPSLPLAFKLARLFKLPIEEIFDDDAR